MAEPQPPSASTPKPESQGIFKKLFGIGKDKTPKQEAIVSPAPASEATVAAGAPVVSDQLQQTAKTGEPTTVLQPGKMWDDTAAEQQLQQRLQNIQAVQDGGTNVSLSTPAADVQPAADLGASSISDQSNQPAAEVGTLTSEPVAEPAPASPAPVGLEGPAEGVAADAVSPAPDVAAGAVAEPVIDTNVGTNTEVGSAPDQPAEPAGAIAEEPSPVQADQPTDASTDVGLSTAEPIDVTPPPPPPAADVSSEQHTAAIATAAADIGEQLAPGTVPLDVSKSLDLQESASNASLAAKVRAWYPVLKNILAEMEETAVVSTGGTTSSLPPQPSQN